VLANKRVEETMKLGRYLLLGVGSAALLAGASTAAQAGAFGLRSQSTIAIGQAYAGAASGAAGVSSMFWNPATITMHPGRSSEYNITYVDASARINVLPGTSPLFGTAGSGELAQAAFVPATYTAYQLTDRVWIGLASAAPFGSITKPNDDWAGRLYSRTSRITSLNFAPIVGVKVNEWLSVAAGPTVQYFKAKLNSAVLPVPATAPTGVLKGDDWSAGFTVGATLTPVQGTVLGVGFRSSINHELTGARFTPIGVAPIRVKLNTPEQLTFGVTQSITPDFKLSAGFEWMNWSRLGSPAIINRVTGANLGPFPLNYKDGYLFSLGGEYQLNPQWALRAGIGYEISPIDVSNRSTRLPDTDRVHASIGASYQFNDMVTLNASYAHYFAVGSKRIAITPGNPLLVPGLPFVGEVAADVNLFSFSATIRWDNPKVAEAAPIIRKY
jgi:long-chain fatty acid transport protein